MKNTKLKNIIKAALFLAGVWLLLSAISYVVTMKESKAKLEGFFREKNDFDVLLIGASHVKFGIFPMELYEDFGIASYNLAEAGNTMPSRYWVIKNALDYTTPKLVIIDAGRMDEDSKYLNNFVMTSYDRLPLSLTKYKTAMDLYDNEENRTAFLFPIVRYHSRWKSLTEEDFGKIPYFADKGSPHYDIDSINVSDVEIYPNIPKTEKKEGAATSVRYLKNIIELLQSRNIDVLLLNLPNNEPVEKQRLTNGVSDIASEYGIGYLNFRDLPPVVNEEIDYNDDMGHLNESGARKCTAYIGSYIKTHYELPDRRKDPAFSAWNGELDRYHAFKLDRIVRQAHLDSYLCQLSDDDYSSIIYVKAGCPLLSDGRMGKLIKNIAGDMGEGTDFSPLKEAENGEDGLLLIFDRDSDKVFSSASGSAEFTASFGNIRYGTASDSQKYLFIGDDDKNYLLEEEPEEGVNNELKRELRGILIERETGNILHSADFVIEKPKLENLKGTKY